MTRPKLPRPCRRCDKRYTPTTRRGGLCPECFEESKHKWRLKK